MNQVLGIIGAGKLGTSIGRAASDAGWQVVFYDAEPKQLESCCTAVPGAVPVTLPKLIAAADIVLLAVPFSASGQLDYTQLDDKIVVDAMNYWPAVDGEMPGLSDRQRSASQLVATRNPRMRLVKSLNHFSYHDYTSDARSAEVARRRAMAVASDDAEAAERCAQLVDDIGFDPVKVPFDRAKLLEPGGPIFGVWLDAAGLRRELGLG